MYLLLLKKYGICRAFLLIILAIDATAAGLHFLFLSVFQGYASLLQIVASVVIPTIIAPFFVYTSLRNMLQLRATERSLQDKNADLEKAANEIKRLGGLLPICASCKKIRDDKGYWNRLETYISEHADVQFSHGICPDCARKLYSHERS